MPEQEAITVNELIARNVYRLRRERGWTQAELAERMTAQTGESWDNSMVSKSEWNPRRERRQRRQFNPDEMVAVARVLDVSMLDLFVESDEVVVEVGGSAVRAGDFFRLTFMIPASYRQRIGETFFRGGQSGAVAPTSELGRRAQIVREAVGAVYSAEEMQQRFPGVDRLSSDQLADLLAERDEEIVEWIVEHHGVETARAIYLSDRTLDVVEEIYPGTKAERQRRQER